LKLSDDEEINKSFKVYASIPKKHLSKNLSATSSLLVSISSSSKSLKIQDATTEKLRINLLRKNITQARLPKNNSQQARIMSLIFLILIKNKSRPQLLEEAQSRLRRAF
jgi:hypothetical protein